MAGPNREELKKLIREVLTGSVTGDSKLGTVTKNNSGSSADILLDGQIVSGVRTPFSTVKGQTVAVLNSENDSPSVAVPLNPNPASVVFEPPPYFTGGGKLRFVVDESYYFYPGATEDGFPEFEGPTVPGVRIQDQGSNLAYRFLFEELTLETYGFSNSPAPCSLSEDGKYVAILFTFEDVLTKMEQELQGDTQNKELVQVIQALKLQKWYLEAINHNPNVFALEGPIEDAWDQMKPLIEYIFRDYKKRLEDQQNENIN